jgi:hypothetical protein
VTEAELARALRERAVPGEREAAERALRVIQAGAGGSRPVPRRGRGRRLAVVVALALVVCGGVLSPAGADVREFIADRLSPAPEPTLSRLPAPGRILVSSSAGTSIVAADGGIRRLGPYTDASWSPRGLFVAGTVGRRLYALEPDGTVRWSLARPGPVSLPAWSPGDGYRVAYLQGRDLRVVAGDGSDDRRLASPAAGVRPAWRPGAGHVLSYVTTRGAVVTRDVDTGRVLWTARTAGGPVVALAWSHDGAHLAVLTRGLLSVRYRDGRRGPSQGFANGFLPTAMALARSGRRAVLAGTAGGVLSVPLFRAGGTRRVFAGDGDFSGVAVDPSGRWVLAGWRAAGQWVFVGRRKVVTFSRIARQLDPKRNEFPRIEGWCC